VLKSKRTWLLAALTVGMPLLAGCNAGTGSDQQVRLVVTPVATPTHTPITPPTPAPTTYTVKAGDTLSGIAGLFGVSVDDIVRVNNITDPNVLSEGQVLNIPARSAGGTPAETPAGVGTPSPTGSPAPAGSPELPPPNVTPPLGPTTGVPSPGASSSPGTTISPTAEP
jgi:LysM repeat protein